MNIILTVGNVFFFAMAQCLFWWFFSSRVFSDSIGDKARLVAEMVAATPEGRAQLEATVTSVYAQEVVAEGAKEARKSRERENFQLMKDRIFPFLYVSGAIVLVAIMLLPFRRTRVGWPELILVCCVIGAFSTEAFFTVAVIQNIQYVENSRVVLFAMVTALNVAGGYGVPGAPISFS